MQWAISWKLISIMVSKNKGLNILPRVKKKRGWWGIEECGKGVE